MARITMVKKVLADGRLCRKCAEVEARLRGDGLWGRIDRVLVADERDPGGEAWALARHHGVTAAPFFVVEEAGGARVYTSYLRFRREVLRAEHRPPSALELLEGHPELELL